MIGGGFRGNFPGGGNGEKPKSKLGIIANSSSPHNRPSVPGGPRVLKNHALKADKSPKKAEAPAPRKYEVSWNGAMYGYSGYAKANREIVKRLSSFVKVGLGRGVPWNSAEKDPYIYKLFQYYNNISVSNGAPVVTFNPPQVEPAYRYKIIYTMMETETVHPDMIRVMNENYKECWVPTHWNAGTFRRSGLALPIHVMPLGVDPTIYAPSVPAKMPEAILVSTSNAGRVEVPNGFTFISVGQPTFRKGFDVLLEAFEEAFYGDNTVALILGTTDYSVGNLLPRRDMTTKVYALSGAYGERELASVYKACQVYVSCSRGEGWDLPACESGAVGLPLILSRNSAHTELVPERFGHFFDAEGMAPWPGAGEVTPWFDGIPFPVYGHKSRQQLIGLMKQVKNNYAVAAEMGAKFSIYVRSRMSWGSTARLISERIKALPL